MGLPRFSLRGLFEIIGYAAILSLFIAGMRNTYHVCVRSTYGLGRFTRQEAEVIAGRPLPELPDEEFQPLTYYDQNP